MPLHRHTISGQSRLYQVTQLRTDDVHCREPADLNVVPVTGAPLFRYHHGPIFVHLCFTTSTIGTVVVFVSHIQRYWLPNRNSYLTRWPIPVVVCLAGKREQEERKSACAPIIPVPRPSCSYGGNIIKIKHRARIQQQQQQMARRALRDASKCLLALRRSRSVSHSYRVHSSRQILQLISLRRFYTSVCDNNFPSLVASLFSWRCLAASTSSFLHAPTNLRPPFVTVSAHTSASNPVAVAFQSPAMPNARMSLWTQSVHSFSFPPRPLSTAPSRFPNTIRFGSRPPLHSDERPRPQKSSRAQRCLNALTRGYLKGTVVQGHPMVWPLALCPDDAKEDPVVYGAEFEVVFLAKGPRTISKQ